jgi:hypothetical protein
MTMPWYSQWGMLVVFAAVLVAVPVLWYLVGRDTYGTGDYYQP